MADYLLSFSYTPETLRAWMDDPIDRTPLIADAVERLGGELKGFWLGNGAQDGYLLLSAAEPVTPMALAVLDMAGGFTSSMKATPLLGVDEMRAALGKAHELLNPTE
ncbi:MAG: hypothetical protein QOF17_1169 [Solirubrobacteraceae bacterium]|jgi:uncharacterized protein with GYD domain|nr:hypothetical protein [Solirubrobacteraceae bacterium]